MADVRKTILFEFDAKTGKITDENGKVVKSFAELSAAYDKVEKSQKKAVESSKRYSEEQKKLDKLQQNQARSAGLAGAATFELGRTISDLPFGLVAISNNISQLGTLMSALVANAGGLRNAFNLIKQQLLGPGGILIAFQVITAAVTYFAQRSNKAKEEVSKFNITLASQVELLERIVELKQQGGITSEEELNLLRNYSKINKEIVELFEQGVISEQEKNKLVKQSYDLAVLRQKQEVEKAARDENAKEIELELIKLNERKFELEQAILLQRQMGGVSSAKNIKQFREQLLVVTEEIRQKEAEKSDILIQEVDTLGEINTAESAINDALEDAVTKKERLLELEKQRAGALSELVEVQIEEAQTGVDEAVLEQDEDKFLKHYSRLLELKQEQLSKQREEELKDVKDDTVINAINAKYDILFNKLGKEFNLMFIQGMEDIGKDIPTMDIDSLYDFGKDSYFSFKKGFAEKFIDEGYEGFFDVFKPEEQDPYFPFVDLLDLEIELALETEEENKEKLLAKRRETLDAVLNLAKAGLEAIGDVLMAEADREIAIEQNKTNALNDQLKQRLANEQLSADERDRINQQIARNEAALVAKENAINKKRFEQQKAFNIALAVIDTYVAANQALRDESLVTTFAKVAAMVSIIGTGLANVATISRQQFTAKAMPSPNLTGQGTGGTGDRVFNVVGASQQTQIAQAIAAMQQQPVKAYVVSSDVTSAQEMDRKIIEGASI